MNIILTVLGLVSLGLGILGIFLPVLPTIPLLLLAAALFLRGNRRLYDWLLNHQKLGPYITNFMKYKKVWGGRCLTMHHNIYIAKETQSL